ncbi:MAG: glutamate--tRNA ligase family protein, partial [Halobacteriota archaeon]
MDAEVRERVEGAAEVHALLNAIQHEGTAQVGAVVGALMAEHPTFREHGDDVAGVVAPVVEAVNALSVTEQRERLRTTAPDRLAALEAEPDDEADPLGDLPNVDAYDQVRMRLAPNPNGQWHLGNARMPSVIGTYKDRYDGWMLCRFDDTDPDTKRPELEAYDAILRDLAYLGFEPDEVIRASDRLELYYDRARELIDLGGAYTCSCPAEAFRDLKAAGEACPHRGKGPSTVREEFDRMVDGSYDAGEMVLRVRTEIDHDNPALRDWVAFRIVDRPHPRDVAAAYRCWPMLDFQSGIDDHEMAITHIIRGIDLQDSAKRQR